MIKVIIPIITIWVHGTRPTECVPTFLKKMVCSIENVLFIDQKEAGLVNISEVSDREYITGLANRYCQERICELKDFYFYVWSGKLSPKERRESSVQLYREIDELIAQYQKQYGVTPLIEIIAHSHGGNVALLMSEEFHHSKSKFFVDRLVLLGCPVQKMTKMLITSPMFKKIYNIHSHNDWIQVLDPQGLHFFLSETESNWPTALAQNFFSARHFDPITDNLTQVHVQWDVLSNQDDERRTLFPLWLQKRLEFASKLPMRRGLFHIEFTLTPFACQLPSIINQIEAEKMQPTISKSGNKKKDIKILLS